MPQANSSRNRSANGGNDQSMMSQWSDTARDRPFTTAAAAAGAVAAGVFLWSKRNQISEQIGRLSDQITEWADEMRSANGSDTGDREMAFTAGSNESSAIESSRPAGARSGSGRSSSSPPGSRSTSSRATGAPSRPAGQDFDAGGGSTSLNR